MSNKDQELIVKIMNEISPICGQQQAEAYAAVATSIVKVANDLGSEIKQLRHCLSSVIESYDMLIKESPLKDNDVAIGVIKEILFNSIAEAKIAITRPSVSDFIPRNPL